MLIIQLDIAKGFDRLHRGEVRSFTDQLIMPQAPEAAAFITAMYDGDSVMLSNQSAAAEVKLEAGIRQGDPLSPALFSAMAGPAITPVLAKWEAKGWGYKGTTRSGREFRVPMLAYADDIAIMAATPGASKGYAH